MKVFFDSLIQRGLPLWVTLFFIVGVDPVLPAELRLLESTPWLAKHVGPAASKGVIYWIQGFAQDPPVLDAFHLAPHFLKTLSEDGWDVIEGKVSASQSLTDLQQLTLSSVEFVESRLRQLKSGGYSRVILGGQSWGGWVAALAAGESRNNANGLLLSAPDIAPPTKGGVPNPYFSRNVTEFPALIGAIKTPTILMLFADDEYESGERGKTAEHILSEKGVPHRVIDKPSGFTGHFAAWSPIFDYVFGQCISDFLKSADNGACKPQELSDKDYRSVLNIDRIEKPELITSDVDLVGKNFVSYSLKRQSGEFEYIGAGKLRHLTFVKNADVDYSFRGSLHCIGELCFHLVRWSAGQFFAFNPRDGTLGAWWLER
jgi:hypothetical protein